MAEINNKKMEKKIKKETKWRNLTDEQREVIRFVLIIVIIIIFVLGVYGISKLLIKDKEEVMTNKVTPGAINYDLVSVGTMFNRPIDEYYVIIYDSSKNESIYYSGLINKYTEENKALKVYLCDLDNKLNQKYYVGEGKSNPKAKDINDLALGDFTLVKIKNGKIVKYIETVEGLQKEWNIE